MNDMSQTGSKVLNSLIIKASCSQTSKKKVNRRGCSEQCMYLDGYSSYPKQPTLCHF